MPGWLRNWLKVRFLTGFFVTVPAIATAWLLYVFWDAIDEFFSPGYQHIFGRRMPGLGFLTAVLLILFIGTIATNVVGRRIIGRIERLLTHVPIFRSIYPSVKQLLESFSPEKRSSFKSVVLAEHPRKGEFVFGFVTAEVLVEGTDGKRQMVTVFVPTNNLYLGDVIVLPREDVLATGLTVEEGIRIILSAGTATPPRFRASGRDSGGRPTRAPSAGPLLRAGRACRRRSGPRPRCVPPRLRQPGREAIEIGERTIRIPGAGDDEQAPAPRVERVEGEHLTAVGRSGTARRARPRDRRPGSTPRRRTSSRRVRRDPEAAWRAGSPAPPAHHPARRVPRRGSLPRRPHP